MSEIINILQTDGTSALAVAGPVKPVYGTVSDDEKLRKIGIDPNTPMSDDTRATLIRLYDEQMAEEAKGAVLRYKILKDSRCFETPWGENVKEVRGVVAYHTQFEPPPRTRWVEGEKRPVCKSFDGVTGTYVENGITCTRRCSECEYNSRSVNFNANLLYKDQCKASPIIAMLVKDVPAPIVIALAPTMIKHARKYFERKLALEGIPPASRETIITLTTETKGTNTWAVPQFELGDPVPPAEFIRICSMKQMIKAALALYIPEKDDIQGPDEASAEEDPPF